jgi:Tfp pilus assembly protein PilF
MRSGSLRGAVCLASVLAGASLAASAQARDGGKPDAKAEARAREEIQKGGAALRAGRYDEAMAAFEAGYAAVPLPGFILNMGHVQRQAGNLERARDYYRRYLELDPKSSQRADVEKTIAEIDARFPAKGGGAQAPRATPPPQPKLGLPAAQDDHEEPAGLKALPAKPVVTASPARTDDEPFYTRWWFWTAVGAVAAAGVVAFFLVGRGDDYTTSGTWGTLGQ